MADDKKRPPGKYSADVVRAAQKSNDTDDAPREKFRSTGMATSMGWVAGDPDGRDSKRVQEGFDRKDLKDMLPSGTDRLVNAVKNNVRTGVGVPSFKRGGTMKYRGVAKLHKGERAAKKSSSRKSGR